MEQLVATRGMKWVLREPTIIPLGSGLAVVREEEPKERESSSEVSEEEEENELGEKRAKCSTSSRFPRIL